jgi:hypothetical protein
MTVEHEARIAPLPAGIMLASITTLCCLVVSAPAQGARAITPSCGMAFGARLCVSGKMLGQRLVELDATIPMAAIASAPAKGAMVWPPAEAAVVPMPAEVRTATGIDHLTFYWEPMGHPPKPFETPHFDFHFYTIPDSARRAIDCADKTKPAALPAGYSLEDITVPGVGLLVGTCVPRMGMHAGNYSHGPVPFHAMMVLGSYHGQPIFFEPMIAQKTLLSKQPLVLKVATPAGTSATVHYPAKFAATYNATTDAYTFAFTGFKP